MPNTDVLIVGAGPTGLVLALSLTTLGVRVRIIDKTEGPGTTSRAIIMHARNLEFYRQLGIVDKAVEAGLQWTAANLWVSGKRVAQVQLGNVGGDISRYPYMLIYPQDQQENMLIEQLERLGVRVERQAELISFESSNDGVKAQIKAPDGAIQTCEARYLAGCDGAHSKVREELGTGFPGGAYADVFYVADVLGEGPPVNGRMHVTLDDADFLVVFPMKQQGSVRLVGAVRRDPGKAGNIRWEDVSQRIIEHLNLKVREVRWFSTYHVHHRVAAAFRRGPVFLLGDAAHIHSPVGGQGMNTGIGDAVNLAWKLAAVLQGRIDPAALDTYETERIAFARKLVKTTDRAFEFVTARGSIARRVRLTLIPFLLPKLFKLRSARRRLFRMVSQVGIRYRDSWLSWGSAGRVKGGDRLPWIKLDEAVDKREDNYACLETLDWQVHCYGNLTPAVRTACEMRRLKLEPFAWRSSMRRIGLKKAAVYLIRPDGYIGLAEPAGDAGMLEHYLEVHKISMRRNATEHKG